MEPFTQALLGAATAELAAGRAMRGRALGWGAAIGMAPDLDVLLGPLHDGYGEWLYHRGTTHALWFGPVVGPLLGWLLWRWRDLGRAETLPGWIRLAVVALFTHPLLDGFTPYGTQLFAPFDRTRFAWNGVAIVDPAYSLLLGAGVAIAALRAFDERTRLRAVSAGLLVSTAYLLAGLGVNRWVEHDLRRALADEVGRIERLRAYPTIFQPWLRSIVVHTPEAVVAGLHSWQEAGCPAWRVHPRPPPDAGLERVRESGPGRLLAWFADGDVATFVEPLPDGGRVVRLEDVRYAWASAEARGLWGIEARLDANGRPIGGIRRLARPAPGERDLARLGALLRGRLPGADAGWQRPPGCGSRTEEG